VDAGIDLAQLQQVVGKYVDQYNLVVAAGPLTAASLTRAFITKNKLASGAVAATGAWFAIKELSGPMLNMIQDQFGYLLSILNSFSF
jgi:hypothetical protein